MDSSTNVEDKDAVARPRPAVDVALVEREEAGGPASIQHDVSPRDASVTPTPDTARQQPQHFRLYRGRYFGVLGIMALNIVAGMSLTWFGPIADDTSETFGISLDQVTWLGNIVGCTYIVTSPFVPLVCTRFGLRISYAFGSAVLILSAWVRFAGTARTLGSQSAYALLIIGQFLAAIPQVIFQLLVPKFSETWIGLKGRTTATMLMSVSNPVGTALGQLISPMIDDVRTSILVLGIISTAVAPFTLLVGAKPPTPPSYSGSQPSRHFLTTLRAIFGLLPRHRPRPRHATSRSVPLNKHDTGKTITPTSPESGLMLDSPTSKGSKVESSAENPFIELRRTYSSPKPEDAGRTNVSGAEATGGTEVNNDNEDDGDYVNDVDDAYMTVRERIDFVIITTVFGVLCAGVTTFSILSDQILEPYGYSDDTAGLMGAALLLCGLVAALATSPLFDRVLTHHLALSARITIPFVAIGWFSLIWAVRPNNTGALYAIFVVIGVCSISMLPVSLELGCEVTRDSEGSSAILWWSANVVGIVFVLVMSALRAPATASPPQNMHRSLIYQGTSVFACALLILLLRGHQRRREKDAWFAAAAAAAAAVATAGEASAVPTSTSGLNRAGAGTGAGTGGGETSGLRQEDRDGEPDGPDKRSRKTRRFPIRIPTSLSRSRSRMSAS